MCGWDNYNNIMQVDLYSMRVDTKLLESHILFDVVFFVT